MNLPNRPPVPECIESDCLALWRPRVGDGAAVFEAVVETLTQLREFPSSQPWALSEPSVTVSEQFCLHAERDHLEGKDFPFLMFQRTAGRARSQLIGCCGLHRPKWNVPSFEIGYWCRASAMRRGFATEAAGALLQFAMRELQAQRVVITTDADNLPSRNVAERIGMQLEGMLRNYWREPGGALRSACVYSAVPPLSEEHAG